MRVSVKQRILLGFGVVLAILIVSTTISWWLNRSIGTQVAVVSGAYDRKAEAVDMDLVTQKVRVRVNQWLRSMNPDFAKQADELLVQQGALMQKADANSAPGPAREIIRRVDAALKAYIVSWRVVQDFYAEEARLYVQGMQEPGSGLLADIAALRDAEASGPAIRAIRDLRDHFADAMILSARYRVSQKADDATRVIASVEAAAKAAAAATHHSDQPRSLALANRISAVLTDWHGAFDKARAVAAARAARVASWTKDEGEVMAQGANALRAEAEKAAAAAQAELTSELARSEVSLLASSILAVLIGFIASFVLVRSITGPILRMTQAMKALAGGNPAVEIPETDRRDEIGDMAKAAAIFKDNAIQAQRLATAQEAESEAKALRAERLEALTRSFETNVSALTQGLAGAATQMEATAGSMSETADQTIHSSATVAGAADETAANVHTVAAASEEMSASIQEIAAQVSESSAISARAVADAQRTDATVQRLSGAAGRITDVVALIHTIAGQTNLLALNATIEAARAGEPGRGFAVVASEVKELAGQTAKATDEIAGQIGEIQQATNEVIADIARIARTIGDMSTYTSGIAAAMEEQGAATAEIARNVQEAAQGTQQVTRHIGAVRQGADVTGQAAAQVLQAARALSNHSAQLGQEVDHFLAEVKAA